jgi:tRNA pseudouridine32 synthase/23S rRNA pseudouridine746 synthase
MEVVQRLIATQQHHDPTDDLAAVLERFFDGAVRLDNGHVLAPDEQVAAGEFIWFYRRPAPERRVPGELRELYRDERLLVVDKPPFMSTLPRGQHITETAVVRARRQFGISALSPAHRLDRLTRGVLLFTTRQDVRGAYQRLFESRSVQKTYEAVTSAPPGWAERMEGDRTASDDLVHLPVPEGAFAAGSAAGDYREPTPGDPWTLRHHMVKLRGRMATFLTDDVPNAETRVTGVRLGATGPDGVQRVVWTLEPHSGRTHQLRVNMRLFGTPIVADPLYGELSDAALWDVDGALPFVPSVADEDFDQPMALTAIRMIFTDPVTGDERTFHTAYTSTDF